MLGQLGFVDRGAGIGSGVGEAGHLAELAHTLVGQLHRVVHVEAVDDVRVVNFVQLPKTKRFGPIGGLNNQRDSGINLPNRGDQSFGQHVPVLHRAAYLAKVFVEIVGRRGFIEQVVADQCGVVLEDGCEVFPQLDQAVLQHGLRPKLSFLTFCAAFWSVQVKNDTQSPGLRSIQQGFDLLMHDMLGRQARHGDTAQHVVVQNDLGAHRVDAPVVLQ